MIPACLSLLFAFIIAIGRPSAVFGKIRASLWFFSRFEQKRLVFALISVLFAIAALYFYPNQSGVYWLISFSAFFILIAFLLDFKYIFPEIVDVKRQKGTDANIDHQLEVIGVSVDDVAVAYPSEVVFTRHIVNDSINGQGVVAAYCALCRSGLIFSSEIDGVQLYFTVSGVWRRNMIMTDRQTGSLWQQATGMCIYGTFKGRSLNLLSGENTTWGVWLKKFPESEFAIECKEARRGFLSRKTMLKGLKIATNSITPPGFSDLSGLEKRETIFGISFNGIERAYPETELIKHPNFLDYFGNQKVNISYNPQAHSLSAIDEKGHKLLIERHWWLGWKEFHPNTEIWKFNN